MTRSIREAGRAGLLLTGGVATATLLLSGCGSGQIAETAAIQPAIAGVNVQTADNLFKVRDLAVVYPGVEGYPSGGNAPLGVGLFNDSTDAVTVTVSTSDARSIALRTGTSASNPPGGGQVTAAPGGSASVSPGAAPSTGAPSTPDSGGITSPTPSEPAAAAPSTSAAAPSTSAAAPSASVSPGDTPAGPARIEIPAGGYVLLNQSAGAYLELVGLREEVKPGTSVEITFEVNGTELSARAPVTIPLTPAPTVKITGEAGESEPGAEGGHG